MVIAHTLTVTMFVQFTERNTNSSEGEALHTKVYDNTQHHNEEVGALDRVSYDSPSLSP